MNGFRVNGFIRACAIRECDFDYYAFPNVRISSLSKHFFRKKWKKIIFGISLHVCRPNSF